MNTIPASVIKDFFRKLTETDINYALIKNVSNELPHHLQDKKDIDILVHASNMRMFEEFMSTNNFEKITHPLGRKNGWNFAYKLPEYQFWRLKEDQFTLYIDASFKLSCKSLTPRTWIPLDNCINEDIWLNKVYDSENCWWIMDDETILIYLLVRSVFDKREFRPGYIDGIEKRKSLLMKQSVQNKLRKVFFKYTDLLTDQIMMGEYDNIIYNYLKFSDY